MNCDYSLGSVAELECLWSIAYKIVTDDGMRMTPQLFESITLLRVNELFWDIHSVQ